MPLSEKEVLGALAALEESACLLRGQWYAERHFRHKGRIDLVTTMDVKIQQTLGAALGRVTPGVPLVAEEGNDGEPVFPERCWIVDPIDGTTNFVHGIPLVGITAAFWEHDGPVFGMTACPMLNETWWAVKGQGAFLNGRPVSVSAAEKLEDAVVATGFPYDIRETCDAVVARMAGVLPIAQGMRRMGAASLDLTYVACGRQDAYYESELHPWDYMAGWLIVEEAGGTVTNDRGTPFRPGQCTGNWQPVFCHGARTCNRYGIYRICGSVFTACGSCHSAFILHTLCPAQGDRPRAAHHYTRIAGLRRHLR